MSPDVLFSRNTAVVVEILLSSGDIEWRTNLLSLAPDMFHLSGVSQCLHLMLPVLLPRLALELPAGPSPFFDEVLPPLLFFALFSLLVSRTEPMARS